ncbi:NlpC/P60 family protein [Streptomyces sp. ME19-01-6]|uniref:C40 family peptidase n=1 Tax=Streptomyces sp. ME19-01-6 TaxID=3028686 RepID=UPI0029A5F779|nr:NlpC/P60 family protein [Streptomyces sp. ME19-01-6]MDX3233726.1 NlpC/P60 family protein [Streptomyces sp. ME19-01-6]
MRKRKVGRDGRRGGAGVAAATAFVCAVGMSAGPQRAQAAPREPTPGAGTGAESGSGPGGTAGAASGGGGRLQEVHKKVESLYRKAEAATDAYNLAREKQARQEKRIVKIAQAVVKAQKRMAGLRKRAGAVARAQYRNGGIPPEAQLLLGDDPEGFLDDVTLARKGQQATRGLMNQLEKTQATLDRYAKAATREWERLDSSRAKKAAARKEIRAKLTRARQLESRLRAKERERLRQLEEEQQRRAQTTWLGSGILRKVGGKGTSQGRRAVDFATAQLGKDYVWGAEGPDTYDCSGLTQKAWAASGRSIPRTSQEQWRQLPKVSVERMRPGDLIIYFKDASHVGMYVGDGAIVHAPRPGRQITVAGAGSMPILGVVRPDGG